MLWLPIQLSHVTLKQIPFIIRAMSLDSHLHTNININKDMYELISFACLHDAVNETGYTTLPTSSAKPTKLTQSHPSPNTPLNAEFDGIIGTRRETSNERMEKIFIVLSNFEQKPNNL